MLSQPLHRPAPPRGRRLQPARSGATSAPPAPARRAALLAAAAAPVLLLLPPPPRAAASAGLLDDLEAARRVSNARFLVGSVSAARDRLRAAQAVASDAEAALAVDAAALDCLSPSAALGSWASVRDVCTLRIVARSAVDGPAARWAAGSPERGAVEGAARDAVEGLAALRDALAAGRPGARALFGAAFGALDRLQAAVEAALRVTPAQLAR